jgi:hypothetical protein
MMGAPLAAQDAANAETEPAQDLPATDLLAGVSSD